MPFNASVAEHLRRQFDLDTIHQLVCRVAESNAVTPGVDTPLLGGTIEVPQQTWLCAYRQAPRLAGFERHPLEAQQAHVRLAEGVGQVELRYVGALALPRVGHSETGAQRVATADLQLAIFEVGVGKPVAEGEQGFLALLGKPAIA